MSKIVSLTSVKRMIDSILSAVFTDQGCSCDIDRSELAWCLGQDLGRGAEELTRYDVEELVCGNEDEGVPIRLTEAYPETHALLEKYLT